MRTNIAHSQTSQSRYLTSTMPCDGRLILLTLSRLFLPVETTHPKPPPYPNMAQDHPGLGVLVRLPREVRDLIYEHYFAGAIVYQEFKYKSFSTKVIYPMRNIDKGLLDVSKAIRAEACASQSKNITLSMIHEGIHPPRDLCEAASGVVVDSLVPFYWGDSGNEFHPFDARRYKNLTTLHIRKTTLQSKWVPSGPIIRLDDSKIKQYLQHGHHEDYILEAIREKWSLFEDPFPVVNYCGPGLMVRTSVTAWLTGGWASGLGPHSNRVVCK